MSDTPRSAFRVPPSAFQNSQSGVDRRGILRLGAAAGLAALLGRQATGAADAKTRVVAAVGRKVFADGGAPRAEAVRPLVDAAVASLLEEKRPADAWRRLVKPGDLVGIKVNCLAGERLSTRIEVVRAIADSVMDAGVPRDRIVVWDRKRDDLVRARYPVADRSGFICAGNDDAGYSERLIMQGEIGSMFSRLVTEHCSVIINVPVFKDHDLAGVSLALKSAFGAIHNPNKYHLGNLQQAIVDVNRVQCLRAKTVIHICDALFGCYNGGPKPVPRWLERFGTIYASRDPVALDATAWRKMEELRKARDLPSLVGSKREPKHIALGAENRLGTNDPAQIEVVNIEV